MSVFKTSGIVLKVKKQNEKESLYTVLFKDYGILIVQKKKKVREKSLDIGYHIGCEIITKGQRDIHTIGNIKIHSQFIYEERNYKEIELYLRIIGWILKEAPKGVPNLELQEILEYITKNSSVVDYSKLLLVYIKIQCIFGNIGEDQKDDMVRKIVLFTRNHKIQEIFKLTGIDEEITKKLESIL